MRRSLVRRVIRRVVAGLAPAVSAGDGRLALRLLKRLRSVTFVVYHEVTDRRPEPLPAGLVTSVERFEREVAWLREHFEIIPIAEAFDRLARGSSRSHAVVLCFDDGYRGVAEHAYPRLAKEGIPATLFLNSAFYLGLNVGLRLKLEFLLQRYPEETLRPIFSSVGPGDSVVALARRSLPRPLSQTIETLFREAAGVRLTELYLHEEDLRAMSPALITVGNHTRTHAWLPALSAAEQEEEILESHRVLAGLPHFRPCLAIPFGTPDSYNGATLDLVVRHYGGYLLTGYGGLNTRAKPKGAVHNIRRNAVSDRKPPLPELLLANYLTTLVTG